MTDSEGPVGRPLFTEFRLTRRLTLQLSVVSSVAFFGFAYLFALVFAAVRGTPLEPIVLSTSLVPTGLGWLPVVVALLALVVLHELLHGACMAMYGALPSYGIRVSHFLLPQAFASTTERTFSRNQLLVVLLAPFAVLTVLGLWAMVVSPSPLLVVLLAANAAGSIGDLAMAASLLRYPSSVRVGGLPDGAGQGMGIYDLTGVHRDDRRHVRALSTMVAGSVATFAVITISLFLTVLVSLTFASGNVVLGDPAGRWFLFRHELLPGTGSAHVEVGARTLVGLVIAGGLSWSIADAICRRVT